MLNLTKKSGYTLLALAHEPVNTMSSAFWTALLDSLTKIEQDPTQKGIIIHSAVIRNVFTAGNDLNELYAPQTTKSAYKSFWKIQNTFLSRLLISRLVTIAAIKGAAPAGGCALAICCDYRIATKDLTIGLNEVAIGLSVPAMWMKRMSQLIGHQYTEKICMFANTIKAQEALNIHLVDKLVGSVDELLPAAETLVQELIKLPEEGRVITQNLLRRELYDVWSIEERVDAEADVGWESLCKDSTVSALGEVLKRLQKSKKPKL